MSEYLTGPELRAKLRISRRTLARYRHRPDFPNPIRRSGAALLWRRADVERWLLSREERP